MRRSPLALFLIANLLCSCSIQRRPPATPHPEEAAWTQRVASRESLRGFAHAQMRYRGRTRSFDALILARESGRLRVEILDDLGARQDLWVAREGTLHHWDGQDWEQWSDPKALSRELKVPLSVEQLIASLLGKVEVGAAREFSPEGLHIAQLGKGRVVYERYDPTGLARLVRYEFKRPKGQLELSFEVLELNTALPEELFTTETQ